MTSKTIKRDKFKKLHPRVILLGWVSFLTDVATEMVFPLLPAFLSGLPGGGAKALGLIEGAADSAASLLRIWSGRASDAQGKRKPLIVAGYSLSSLVRPLMALVTIWPGALAVRVSDRIGKGLRGAPRDAAIADVTPPEQRGQAYGFHRAMDHAGAVAGPLLASLLLAWGLSARQVFASTLVPGLLVVLLLVFGLREQRLKRQGMKPGPLPKSSDEELANGKAAKPKAGSSKPMSSQLRWLIAATLVFTLSASSDVFLLKRLHDLGLPLSGLALLWAAHHVVKMAATAWGGRLADRYSRLGLVSLGWAYYALCYLAFAFVSDLRWGIALFMAYGIYFGISEPAEKALLSTLAPKATRGAAFGWIDGAAGLALLPASAAFGWIWESQGPQTAFSLGAFFAGLACLLLLGLRKPMAPKASLLKRK